jgi:DNA-binding MarR family transcriptional regulator
MAEKIEFQFKTPEESPGYLLGQMTLLWQLKQKKVIYPLNLTQTQFVILAALGWLSMENDQVTQVDIANQGNADRMMVSKVLRTLEEKQFISRQEHQTDTRAKVIKLTDEGAKVLQKSLTAIEHADIEFFSGVGNNLAAFNRNMLTVIERNSEMK